jgi:hypothetical protein
MKLSNKAARCHIAARANAAACPQLAKRTSHRHRSMCGGSAHRRGGGQDRCAAAAGPGIGRGASRRQCRVRAWARLGAMCCAPTGPSALCPVEKRTGQSLRPDVTWQVKAMLRRAAGVLLRRAKSSRVGSPMRPATYCEAMPHGYPE